MNLIDEQHRPSEALGPTPAGYAGSSPYQPCESCGAPLDDRQRYCVSCGARHKHADDPAARFLSAAIRRRRAPSPGRAAPAPGRKRATASLATAVMIAVIPVTLGAGVLIGRSSAGGDGKLIAALHAQKAPVLAYSGGAPAASSASGAGPAATTQAASARATPPSSTFALDQGYAVQLATLPSGTDQAAASKAENSDRAKGAGAVGLISQSEFTVTPTPPKGAFVIYSGSYSTQAAAQRALAKLKQKFPAAKLIRVQSSSASAKGAGKVLTKTHFGTAHQVAGYKPNSSALRQGSQVVHQDSHDTGKAASGSGLPDVVSVP